jgi:hypothetical protein
MCSAVSVPSSVDVAGLTRREVRGIGENGLVTMTAGTTAAVRLIMRSRRQPSSLPPVGVDRNARFVQTLTRARVLKSGLTSRDMRTAAVVHSLLAS